MQRVVVVLAALGRWAQKLGPYLMLEILLPGGTLFALLLFLYRSRKLSIAPTVPRPPLAMTRPLIRNVQQGV
jgi:hypothetical protein